jgi:hypothetical protein
MENTLLNEVYLMERKPDAEYIELMSVLHEGFAGVLADLDRAIERRGITDEKNPLCVLRWQVCDVWNNILGGYSTKEDGIKLCGLLEFMNAYVKKLSSK